MSLPTVKQFFNNKVTIRLKNGHRFEGLLSSVNYKNQSLVLEDVEDMGNETDKNFIPHDKKIAEKGFGCEDIEEILFKEKHFCEAKKYNKNDFWDAVSEPVAQQPKYRQKNYGQKGDKPYYKKNYNNDNRERGDYRKREGGNNYQNNRGGNYNSKNYQERQPREPREQREQREQRETRNDYKKKEERHEEENSRDYR